MFANGPGDLGSVPSHVIRKTLKMVLDTSLLTTRQYKVRIKGKVEQSRECRSTLLLYLGVVAIEKGAFVLLSTKGRLLYFYLLIFVIRRIKKSITKNFFTSYKSKVGAHCQRWPEGSLFKNILSLFGTPLKLVDKFTYLGSSVESTEKDIETRLMKAWTAINRLSII